MEAVCTSTTYHWYNTCYLEGNNLWKVAIGKCIGSHFYVDGRARDCCNHFAEVMQDALKTNPVLTQYVDSSSVDGKAKHQSLEPLHYWSSSIYFLFKS